MGWKAAVVATLGVIQYQQQGAIGKYNQQVANRKEEVLKNEAVQINDQATFDIARFDQEFRKLEGEVDVGLSKSGVVIDSGSGARIKEANVAKKMEEATFAKIEGQVARNAARLSQIGTIAKTSANLLSMSSLGNKSIFSRTPKSPFGDRSKYPSPLPGADQ